MSDMTEGPSDLPQGSDGEQDEGSRAPHRVIGTPPPAEARTLLATEQEPPERPRVIVPTGPKAKRGERLVATFFLLSGLASIGFVASYVTLRPGSLDATFRSNLTLGIAMSVAFGAIAAGAVLWLHLLMPKVEIPEDRHPIASTPQERAEFAETWAEGAERSGFVKRPIVRRSLIGASVLLGVAPLVVLRDLGPLPETKLRHTAWVRGRRLLLLGPNTPIRAADFSSPGQMITVAPEGFEDNQDAMAKAAAIIIKMRPGQLKHPTVMNWTVDNIVAYSKICTHVGCPVALYEQTTQRILCPCHQSTFDAARGAQVVFGPAPRALPQLPLGVDSEGFLISTSDYHVPVGPSFWELGGSGFSGGNEQS
ncbi:MAG: Rieske (2Fe-2S) protein [Actinobacteria bacterium]|nr:Rieske (2Fe-2S) protein [Actinomycetota bacterium]MBO0785971.1 Rieske (2Fe-2S) protein [Actinomycetota bacterium]